MQFSLHCQCVVNATLGPRPLQTPMWSLRRHCRCQVRRLTKKHPPLTPIPFYLFHWFLHTSVLRTPRLLQPHRPKLLDRTLRVGRKPRLYDLVSNHRLIGLLLCRAVRFHLHHLVQNLDHSQNGGKSSKSYVCLRDGYFRAH